MFFSSSTEFESERSYSKFAVHTLIHHNGDFQEAARALGKEGYGEPPKNSPRADDSDKTSAIPTEVSAEDFYAYMPMHNYIFTPTREVWPAGSVNARIPPVEVPNDDGGTKTIKPATWLDKNRPVEQMTWAPGEPMIIKDRLVSEGGWIPRQGCHTFNL